MKVEDFLNILDAGFFTGVPDSQLKALCDYLCDNYGTSSKKHVLAANEGNAVGIAAGYYLAKKKPAVVYMQNSGEGNIVNPVASLLNKKVYGIPVIFVVGWRGEPGVHDEPQHIFQGEITLKLLELLGISYTVISKESSTEDIEREMHTFREALGKGESVAFVIKKGAVTYDRNNKYGNEYSMTREEVIRHIIAVSGDDPIISTTGKASRELFELREANDSGHGRDFLTVGSMGHCSSIAMGIALNKPDKRIWCIDGDGASLMHMGALSVMASVRPDNLVHIVINNGAHETVGGQPTALRERNISAIAKESGYPYAVTVEDYDSLDMELGKTRDRNGLCLIEVKCALGARDDLGRPTTTAEENKEAFMEFLNDK